ncbi:MAG TPA: carboxypeptidase-like regulatory domain-containing protein, partial [Vicinamibacterales bacterium]|nr:carboxypeptidase-like regulatory domain-containing protein [Vicinamibacterales bacterium]
MHNRVLAIAASCLMAIPAGSSLWEAQRGAGPGPSPATSIGLIVGRVVDAATGQPVPEAEVTVAMRAPAPPVAMPGGLPGGGPTNVRLLTGADGRFMVRDLPAGNVQISVKASGYVNGSYGQTRAAGPSSPIPISPENKVVA